MTDTAQQPESLDEDALRRRLTNRIALAGVAIVALLGGLAVIDSMYVAPPAAPPKTALPDIAKPLDSIAISPVAEPAITQAATQVAPEPPKPEAVPSIKHTAEPEESAAPSMRLPKPATSIAAEPKQSVTKPIVQQSAPAPAEPPRPLTQGPTAEHGFVLQMGVFNNVENAQELLAKLKKNGVPAQIEARVQVGPFKNKAEADDARAKLKALGMDAGLLIPVHR